MRTMRSNGALTTFLRLLAVVPQNRGDLATPQPPTSGSPDAEQRGKAGLEFLKSVSEAVRVYEQLLEYHGGGQEAHTYLLALGYLGQTPDDDLEVTLRRTIRQHGGKLELQRLWRLLDRHRSRVTSTGPTDRVKRITLGFRRSYDSYRKALDTLANYYQCSGTQVLQDTVREQVCSEGAWLLLDKDIRREVGNCIRREATRRGKKSGYERGPGGSDKPGVRRPVDPRNFEQDSVDALEYLEWLVKKASASRATKPTAQELESFALSAYMTHTEAAAESGRSKHHVKTEGRRSRDKLRRAAEL